jgi:hypothetical protein
LIDTQSALIPVLFRSLCIGDGILNVLLHASSCALEPTVSGTGSQRGFREEPGARVAHGDCAPSQCEFAADQVSSSGLV